MPDFDVAVVGAGHNALVTAAYLAQAGYRVGVFERRRVPGGAVSTIDYQGFRFDLGGSAHILIRLTPVVEELELYRYGLEYPSSTPFFTLRMRGKAGLFGATPSAPRPSSTSATQGRARPTAASCATGCPSPRPSKRPFWPRPARSTWGRSSFWGLGSGATGRSACRRSCALTAMWRGNTSARNGCGPPWSGWPRSPGRRPPTPCPRPFCCGTRSTTWAGWPGPGGARGALAGLGAGHRG